MINEIISLIEVVSKNKVKQIDIIGDDKNRKSQTQQLYDLIVEGKIQSEIDAQTFFFKGDPYQKSYLNRLKRKLNSRLLNTLFFIDVNQSNFTEIQKAYYTCYKEAVAVKILIGRFARTPAIKLAESTIKKAVKFDFTDIVLELARTLRMHYGNIVGNSKKFSYYKSIILKYSKIYQAELIAEEYYSDLIIHFVSSQSKKPELIKKAKKYYLELREILQRLNSYKLNLNSYMLFALRFEMQGDYHNTLVHCEEAIKYFESRPHIASKTVIINFLLKKLGCQIVLKNYSQGEEIAKKCLKLQPEGTINWLIALDYYVILSLHSGQWNKAYQLYIKATKNLSSNNKISGTSERWKIHEAFLNYLVAIGKSEKQNNNFRVSKFLNEVPTFSKDKQGINIPILIIQILFLLQEGKHGEIIDRTESLKTYVHRYLRRDDTFRSNCFIKMLLCLPAASFHKAGVIRRAKKYVDLLHSVPIEKANQSPEVEIIPYETLWEFVLESLDNKFH